MHDTQWSNYSKRKEYEIVKESGLEIREITIPGQVLLNIFYTFIHAWKYCMDAIFNIVYLSQLLIKISNTINWIHEIKKISNFK
jgi:hypothetical protein